MKKHPNLFLHFCLILLLAGLAMAGCNSSSDLSASTKAYYQSINEVSLEKIDEMMTPMKMLEYQGGVEIEYTYEGSGDENLDNGKTVAKYRKDGNIIHVNQLADYPNEQFTHLYFSNDINDANIYMLSNGGSDRQPMRQGELSSVLNESLFGLTDAEAVLVGISENDGNYLVKTEISADGTKFADIQITLEPATGYVTQAEMIYYADGKERMRQKIKIRYAADVEIDFSPKTETAAATTTSGSNAISETLTFSTTDINGNLITDEIMKDAKVIMINFWEPWCGPCVGEMPDLEKLYEQYEADGLLILGVFSAAEMAEEAKQILEDCGITYPVLYSDENLKRYMTEYVPTTIFVDAEGNVLSSEPIIGAKDYASWEQIIEGYLN